MKTYVRPMAGWWRRNPHYLWYMARELSCVFIVVYALVLLEGLARLAQGESAYEDWLERGAGATSIAFHALALVAVLYHAWTWFKVMPRTMPFLRIAGAPVPDRMIVAAGLALSCAASLLLFAAVWGYSVWTVQ